MEVLDATGSFWFPGSEGLAVYGSLVFDPADGTTLTLAGSPVGAAAQRRAARDAGVIRQCQRHRDGRYLAQ
jgi:hypothetical protein